MGTVKRGIKNIFRNKARNIAVILVLTLSLTLILMMINMNFSSNLKVKEIEEKYGNKIIVSINTGYINDLMNKKSGSSQTAMLYFDESIADDISKIDSVKAVNKYIFENFFSKKLIERHVGLPLDSKNRITGVDEKFTHSISLRSINEKDMQDLKLVEGYFFRETDIEQNVALIEKNFAERNNLKVGSKIIINNEKVKVCGIYENKIFVLAEPIYTPLKTAQRLLDLEGKIESTFSIDIDSIDNVQKVVDYINNVISDGKIEARKLIEHDLFLLSGNMIKKISKVSVISSSIVAILIILSVMFINVRNRAKEIGILKAIGASNLNISSQFLIESLAICVIALILSVVVILTTSQVIADFIVEREKSSLMDSGYYTSISEEMPEEDMEKLKEAFLEEPDESERLDRLKITFSPQILIFAVPLTFLLGAIGSLIPAFYISKLRPAEVLRFE